MARPTKYNSKILKKTIEYVNSLDRDEELEQFTISDGEKSTGYQHRLMKNTLPSLARLSRILHVSRNTINEWRKEHEAFSDACEELMALQEAKLIEYGVSGVYAQATVNRILAANHGYVDKSGAPLPSSGPTTLIQNNFNILNSPAAKEAARKYDQEIIAIMQGDIVEKRVIVESGNEKLTKKARGNPQG